MMPSIRDILAMRDANIRRYFPDVTSNAKEMVALADVVEPELNVLIDAILNNTLNLFVYQLNEEGAERWEKMLHLFPAMDDTLDDRRSAILAKMTSDLPYTYRKLEDILSNICGSDGYQIEYDWNKYSIKILVSLGSKKQKDIVQSMTRYILPCNLTVLVDLLFNRHIDLERFLHIDMNAFTHEALQNEVLP